MQRVWHPKNLKPFLGRYNVTHQLAMRFSGRQVPPHARHVTFAHCCWWGASTCGVRVCDCGCRCVCVCMCVCVGQFKHVCVSVCVMHLPFDGNRANDFVIGGCRKFLRNKKGKSNQALSFVFKCSLFPPLRLTSQCFKPPGLGLEKQRQQMQIVCIPDRTKSSVLRPSFHCSQDV